MSPSGGKFFLFGKKELERKTRIGEALSYRCSRTPAALPYVPLPARTNDSVYKVSVPVGRYRAVGRADSARRCLPLMRGCPLSHLR